MSDLTSLFTDTLAKFSFRAVLSAAATLLICLGGRPPAGQAAAAAAGQDEAGRAHPEIPAGRGEADPLYRHGADRGGEPEYSHDLPGGAAVRGVPGRHLAAEDILGNVAGGLVILSAHPFSIGDYVEVGGVAGTVHEISLNHTKLVTPDGHLVMLPNKELASSQMTNYTVLGRRRVVQRVAASYDAPTETVKAACRRALEQTENLLEDPAPTVYLTAYKESSIEYTVYCWATPENWWGAYLALGEHLRDAFREYGVEMTYNHLNVHIIENQS